LIDKMIGVGQQLELNDHIWYLGIYLMDLVSSQLQQVEYDWVAMLSLYLAIKT